MPHDPTYARHPIVDVRLDMVQPKTMSSVMLMALLEHIVESQKGDEGVLKPAERSAFVGQSRVFPVQPPPRASVSEPSDRVGKKKAKAKATRAAAKAAPVTSTRKAKRRRLGAGLDDEEEDELVFPSEESEGVQHAKRAR